MNDLATSSIAAIGSATADPTAADVSAADVSAADVPANAVTISQRIDRQYASLSPQEQRAADAVLDHLGDLAGYSASEIADLGGVSKATVSRFFRRLGYEDFAEVRAQARVLRNLGSPLGGADPGARPGDRLAAHLAAEHRNLERTLHGLRDGRLDAAAGLLAGAGQVAVLGWRNSHPVALHLRQQLAQVRGRVRLLPLPGQSLGEDLADLTAADAAVIVGFRRRPRGLSPAVTALLARGVPLVLIGDDSLAPWQGRVAHLLTAPLDSPSPFDSYAAAMSLVNLLATAVTAHRPGPGRARVSAITAFYEELDELEEPW